MAIGQGTGAGQRSLARVTQIACYVGHRKGDVITLTWTELDAGLRLTGRTQAEVPLSIAAYPELAEELAGERIGVQVVIREGTNRPDNTYTYTHEWRAEADAAGLPKDLQFRDPRAIAATELADGGADVIEMSTHTGHKTTAMAKR